MIELRLLGTLDLKGAEGRAVHSILAQPKRLALLAYLAVHTAGARRDSVVALFWPELDTAHARGALRQSLRFLRRAHPGDSGTPDPVCQCRARHPTDRDASYSGATSPLATGVMARGRRCS